MAVVAADKAVAAPQSRVSAEEICKVLTEKRSLFLGLILRIEKDHSSADDILALATVEALACASQFKGDSSLSSYIGSIVLNVARKYARRQSVRKRSIGLFYEHELSSLAPSDSGDANDEFDMEAIEEAGFQESPSPEQMLEKRQLLEQVEQVLSRIEKRWPEAYRTWRMHRLDDLSYPEICEATGIEPVTARGHVYRISSRLSAELEKVSGVAPRQLLG